MEPLLLAAGQPAESVALASQFLRVYILQVPAMLVFEVLRRFCWAQGLVCFVLPIMAFVALGLHPLALYGFVTMFGFQGSCLCVNFQIKSIFLFLLELASSYADSWQNVLTFDRETF